MSSDRPRTGNYEPYRSLLTINGGSSSIKFALYQRGYLPKRRDCKKKGKIDRIGPLSATAR